MAGFQELIDLITNGEPVAAGTPNRPLRQIDSNTRYLRDLLEAALLGQANFIREATVDINVEVGQPVFFNSTTMQYELAIGNVTVDSITGFLKTADSAQVAGVVYRKLNATKADIFVSGFAELDLSSATDGTILPGVYYLSNAEAGQLTSVLPPSGVPVLQVLQEGAATDTWQVLIKSQFHDFLSDHRHYTYELTSAPAGDHAPPVAGERHVIVNPDSSEEGWLPATDAVFNGMAPAGARFGYNLGVTSLQAIWPPVPLASTTVSAMKSNIYENPAEPTVQGAEVLTTEYVVIDENGIWWMTDCYNEVPWATNLNTGTEESVSVSIGLNDCPVTREDRLFLNWTTSGFLTDKTAVLSLVGRDGSGLTFYCRNTDTEKETGHLEADFDLSLLIENNVDPGHVVFKRYTDGKFYRGPVIESIKSSSPEVVISSDVAVGTGGEYYGNISISANLDITNSEFPVDTVRLNGVEEEFYEEVLALGFPASRTANFRGRCLVPGQVVLAAGTKLKLQFWILGRVSGTVPSSAFSLTYRIIPKPSAVLTPVSLPLTDSALAIDAGVTLTQDQYYIVESAEFVIASGDEVLFTLQRSAPDAYGGELQVLRMRGIPVAGS